MGGSCFFLDATALVFFGDEYLGLAANAGHC